MTQILTLKAKEDENEPFDVLASAVTRVFRVRLGRVQKRWGEAVSAMLEGDLANVKAKNLYLRSRRDSLFFSILSLSRKERGDNRKDIRPRFVGLSCSVRRLLLERFTRSLGLELYFDYCTHLREGDGCANAQSGFVHRMPSPQF